MPELPLDGRGGSERSWDSSCHPPLQLEGWGREQLQQADLGAPQSCCCTPPGCQNLGKSPAKSPFLPVVRVLCPNTGPRAFGVSLSRVWRLLLDFKGGLWPGVGVEVGLERGSQKLWNLQNHFHHLKIRDLPGLPARLPGAAQRAAGAFPFPFPRLPSPPGSLG